MQDDRLTYADDRARERRFRNAVMSANILAAIIFSLIIGYQLGARTDCVLLLDPLPPPATAAMHIGPGDVS